MSIVKVDYGEVGGSYDFNTSILQNLGTFSVPMKNGIIFALDEDYKGIWGLFVVENGEMTHFYNGASVFSTTNPNATYYGYYSNGTFYLKQNSTASYSGKVTIYYYTD